MNYSCCYLRKILQLIHQITSSLLYQILFLLDYSPVSICTCCENTSFDLVSHFIHHYPISVSLYKKIPYMSHLCMLSSIPLLSISFKFACFVCAFTILIPNTEKVLLLTSPLTSKLLKSFGQFCVPP